MDIIETSNSIKSNKRNYNFSDDHTKIIDKEYEKEDFALILLQFSTESKKDLQKINKKWIKQMIVSQLTQFYGNLTTAQFYISVPHYDDRSKEATVKVYARQLCKLQSALFFTTQFQQIKFKVTGKQIELIAK